MNENQKKELNERIIKAFCDECQEDFEKQNKHKSNCIKVNIGCDGILDKVSKIMPVIHSEIEQAEKRAIQTLPAFPIMSEKFKREYRLEGARELAERIIKDYENCNCLIAKIHTVIRDTRKHLSDLEKENV